MRVAFVSGNRETLPDPVLPLGVLYVMAATPDRHSKLLIDLCFEESPAQALSSALRSFEPDVVALGIRNIQRSDYTGARDTLDHYARLVEAAREATPAPIVLGGSGFSVMPGALLAHLGADYGISGDGEIAFPGLLDALESGSSFDSIGNLHRLSGGGVISNPSPPAFPDLNALATPDRGLADQRYYDLSGIDSLQTSRGCPLRCDYCTYPRIEGRVGRLRDPARVVDEFEGIASERASASHVFVVDSVFNLPARHAAAVCRELIERGAPLPWTCYVNPLGFDAALAELMARAGCAGMEVGADSGSEQTLRRLRKGFETDHVRRLHDLARAAGIPDCHTFILGTPGEDLDDVRQTLDFIGDLDPFSAILMIWTDDTEALAPDLAASRRRLRESIVELLDDRRTDLPWWSIPELGVNYDAKLFRMLRRRGLRGPLWQHARSSPLLRPPARAGSRQSPTMKNGATETT